MQLNILNIGTWSDESELRITHLLLLEGVRLPTPGTSLSPDGRSAGKNIVRPYITFHFVFCARISNKLTKWF